MEFNQAYFINLQSIKKVSKLFHWYKREYFISNATLFHAFIFVFCRGHKVLKDYQENRETLETR